MSALRVAVIGGGLAGSAASLTLARGGAEVTLLESRGRLGGAAYSFERDGLRVDNGQHVFLRCCTEYQAFLAEIGAADGVRIQPRLQIPILSPHVPRAQLWRTTLPAPLHLAPALLRYPFLDSRRRISIARAMRALDAVDPDEPGNDERSFGDWLEAHGQDPASIAAVWDLIARPTLNLRAQDASLAQAAQVFQVGLLRGRAAADIGIATVPLGDLHDVAARSALERAGVRVCLRAGVRAIETDDRGYAIRMSSDRTLHSDAVVLAVPPERAVALAPPQAGIDPSLADRLGSSPIVNLHVVYDRPVLDVAFGAGLGTPVQWIFDRTAAGIGSHAARAGRQYVVVTLSAADAEIGLGAAELRARYLPALAQLLPGARAATVETFFVTRDHAATFRAVPGVRASRPSPLTALPRLVLAGAHTDTGWPATMEGAVRSGRAAALALLSDRRAESSDGALVIAPMRIEARALRAGLGEEEAAIEVRRSGIGRRCAVRFARDLSPTSGGGRRGGAVLVAGFCGALDPNLLPGDVVLASEVRGPGGTVSLPDPSILAGLLRRAGLRTWIGPIVSSSRPLLRRARRRELARTGALAVDMESAWLAGIGDANPLAVLRVVLDTEAQMGHPLRTAEALRRAHGALRRAGAALGPWVRAVASSPRKLVLASPRASCAGVDRAIATVERALRDRGAPIYVRRQIVHNTHVVADLERRGARFVQELQEVPVGATVIFSAHGVAPAVRAQARERELEVIDATCPLVSKVHAEARRLAAADFDIVLVGHEGHEEVEGTAGQAPERTRVIAAAAEVDSITVRDPSRVGYVTQTTLAVDETAEVVAALRRRFPAAVGPSSSDICYATQNRQDAVRELARDCELILVVGSENSSNSRRLVEIARRAGCAAILVEEASDIPPELLTGVRRIGVTAGASAPERLVKGVVEALEALGGAEVSERTVADEQAHFKLPPDLRTV